MPAIDPFVLPPPLPIPQPEGAELEHLAREALTAHVGLRVTLRAPTWRQILFTAAPIAFQVPRPPDAVLVALDVPPTAARGDKPAAVAKSLMLGLQESRPRGTTPRSLSARKTLPPPRDAMSAWIRRVFLVTAGPGALRLLVAAGYLTGPDVDAIEEAYPKGLDVERTGLVEAAMAVTAAAARAHQDADLPGWLNEQVLTLMGEHRPTEFFQSLFAGAPEEEEGGGGGSVGAPPSQIVDNTRPAVSTEGR